MGYAKYLITLKWNGFFHSLLAEIWFGSPNAKKNKLLNQMTLFSRSNYLGYIFRKIIFIILHEEFSRLKMKTLLKSHGCTSATQYEESLSVCKRAHIFEASKEMIMLWSNMEDSVYIAPHISVLLLHSAGLDANLLMTSLDATLLKTSVDSNFFPPRLFIWEVNTKFITKHISMVPC